MRTSPSEMDFGFVSVRRPGIGGAVGGDSRTRRKAGHQARFAQADYLSSQIVARSWFRKWLGLIFQPLTYDRCGTMRYHHRLSMLCA